MSLGLLLAQFYPVALLTPTTPATGGDLGSHFWPLHALVHHGPLQGFWHMWNPGNLAGEPLLVHYFPLPFMLMALMTTVADINVAFNVGTILPTLTLPFVVFFLIRRLSFPFPSPLLAAAGTVCFLLNDSYSAWGGNITSSLAGQFAHAYGLNFLVLAVGVFYREVDRRRVPFVSAALFAATVLSHGYVALGIPVAAVTVLLLKRELSWRERLVRLLSTGILSFCLAAWWLVPMLSNAQWTTPYADRWLPNLDVIDYAPLSFLPLLLLGLLAIEFPTQGRKSIRAIFKAMSRPAILLWGLMAFYLAMVWVFPRMGLVDIRAFPQVHLFFCITMAVLVGQAFMAARQVWRIPMTAIAILLCVGLSYQAQSRISGWAKWNYEGWDNKQAFADFEALARDLRGNFSMPRVVFEHNSRNGQAGTTRVFEMLPYFANRATLESVYMQATVTAPSVFAIQANVSNTPSCPFRNFRCPPQGIEAGSPRMRLFGVGDLILQTDEMLKMADESSHWIKRKSYGFWHHYQAWPKPTLVETFKSEPKMIDRDDWQHRFYEWFNRFDGTQRHLLVKDFLPPSVARLAELGDQTHYGRTFRDTKGCRPTVRVQMNAIDLYTSCLGQAHLLKFSYHGALRADSGDPLFMVSPGFIGIIPSQRKIEIRFGEIPQWQAAELVSLAALGFWTSGMLPPSARLTVNRLVFMRRRRRKQKADNAIPQDHFVG